MKKILFDEDVPAKLARDFPDRFSVRTAQQMQWRARKNGELIRLTAQAEFDALITLDSNMERQYSKQPPPLPVIVLGTPDQGEIAHLQKLVRDHVIGLLDRGPENKFYRFGIK